MLEDLYRIPMIRYGGGFILSFVFALYWTPPMRKAALQLGIVDRPDGKLKKHDNAMPYLGGIAVFIAFLSTVGSLTNFDSSQETLGLLLSGSIALMVGLIDDFGALTPDQKTARPIARGAGPDQIRHYHQARVSAGCLAIPLTVLWILAVTNAFNIIDIMDGLASGVAHDRGDSHRCGQLHGWPRIAGVSCRQCWPALPWISSPQLPSRQDLSW